MAKEAPKSKKKIAPKKAVKKSPSKKKSKSQEFVDKNYSPIVEQLEELFKKNPNIGYNLHIVNRDNNTCYSVTWNINSIELIMLAQKNFEQARK